MDLRLVTSKMTLAIDVQPATSKMTLAIDVQPATSKMTLAIGVQPATSKMTLAIDVQPAPSKMTFTMRSCVYFVGILFYLLTHPTRLKLIHSDLFIYIIQIKADVNHVKNNNDKVLLL
ncbi:hypothetical protein CXF85_02300 [Colwellia sp. 75C3]|uniref:hypothetical protein n=1 Tax=Colwellia sp. 75C3 TaxID=888425 RepID=UPI000C31FB4D|nr:hypothetical protein [Colwellia sp. 75C3]PKG85644.1 hypothetical protein CXF85_02300 [Colwellia sp. 75C3]